jgi:GTP pyrophosphokinase
LLHDTVEDTTVTLADLKEKFSEEIASLVDGVTKLTNLPRVTRGEKAAKKNRND